jgi:hypothetical protein
MQSDDQCVNSIRTESGFSLFSDECRTQFGAVSRISANPKGIEDQAAVPRWKAGPANSTENSAEPKNVFFF